MNTPWRSWDSPSTQTVGTWLTNRQARSWSRPSWINSSTRPSSSTRFHSWRTLMPCPGKSTMVMSHSCMLCICLSCVQTFRAFSVATGDFLTCYRSVSCCFNWKHFDSGNKSRFVAAERIVCCACIVCLVFMMRRSLTKVTRSSTLMTLMNSPLTMSRRFWPSTCDSGKFSSFCWKKVTYYFYHVLYKHFWWNLPLVNKNTHKSRVCLFGMGWDGRREI